jgi:hypothetical protein
VLELSAQETAALREEAAAAEAEAARRGSEETDRL